MKIHHRHIGALVLAGFAAGCASLPGSASLPAPAELDRLAVLAAKASFRDEGPVKVDRLLQDDANRECSAADVAGRPIDPQISRKIEAANLKTIKWPSDG